MCNAHHSRGPCRVACIPTAGLRHLDVAGGIEGHDTLCTTTQRVAHPIHLRYGVQQTVADPCISCVDCNRRDLACIHVVLVVLLGTVSLL